MSDAGSNDFGNFLDNASEVGGTRRVLGPDPAIEHVMGTRHNRDNRFLPGRGRDGLRRGLSPSRQSRPQAPIRIRTREPINLRLAPLVDRQADAASLLARARPRQAEARLDPPPSGSDAGSAGETGENLVFWRLQHDNKASESSLQSRGSAESDRFTVASEIPRAGTGEITDAYGTTTEIRRALDSEFIAPPRQKRRVSHENADDQRLQMRSPRIREMDLRRQSPTIGSLGDFSPMGDAGGDASLDRIELPAAFDSALPSDAAPLGQRTHLPSVRAASEIGQADRLLSDVPPSDLSSIHSGSEQDRHDQDGQDGSVVGHRPRDPLEIEAPLVFEVPISMVPPIEWNSATLDADGAVLQQQLEHSESESEDESDAGSVAEIIEQDSESEGDGNAEWEPANSMVGNVDIIDESPDDDDDDEDFVDPDEQIHAIRGIDASVAVSQAREQREKRHRIPTLKWWLGERIEYSTNGELELMTAVDVRRVDAPKRRYRKRRPYRRRQRAINIDDAEADAAPVDVQAPVFDIASREWRDRTVARSISGLRFEPLQDNNGRTVPFVTRHIMFGSHKEGAPLRMYVLRLQAGGLFSYDAEQDKAATFVVWSGKCTVHLNNHAFDLSKGMACLVPRGNDLYVDNGSGEEGLISSDVYLFVTEVNARLYPEIAEDMARDAQSVISGATTTFSRLFAQRSAEDETAEQDQSIGIENEHENDDEYDAGGLDLGAVDFAGDGLARQSEEASNDGLDAALRGDDADSLGSRTDTFGPSFARAMLQESSLRALMPPPPRAQRSAPRFEVPRVIPAASADQAAEDDTRSTAGDSLSLALRGDDSHHPSAGVQRPMRTRLAARGPAFAGDGSDDEGQDSLSDYLDGRKGSGRRRLLEARDVDDAAELRARIFLRRMPQRTSDFSGSS